MSDNEDPNARRAGRPSTPPFRGPAGPAGRPPLTPPAGGPGSAPKATPGQGSPKPAPAAPFALPPAGPRSRPATPAQGQRRPAVTPASGELPPATSTPRAKTATPSESELEAIPAYGSAPPKSVAATLKSISEFTIVEEAAAPAQAEAQPEASVTEPQPESSTTYEAPTVTPRSGEVDTEPAYAPSLADTVEWRTTPADLDAMVTVPPFDPDQAAPREDDGVPTPSTLLALGIGSNDDVIAAAFDASPDSMFAEPPVAEPEDSAASEPELIGGSPSSRFAAECLEEIAQGIRAGEISVPAMAPGAEPPAVLAAVLAALLAPRQ